MRPLEELEENDLRTGAAKNFLSHRLMRLLEQVPILAASGDDSAVDVVLYEVLRFLVEAVGADIGQVNLLPKGGRVEKVCILKDGEPWLRSDADLHLFDPFRGFTGRVMSSGQSIRVRDIWAQAAEGGTNPFLDVVPTMNEKYVHEIKRPVASILISPVKRGEEIFCTVELARYRGRSPFGKTEVEFVERFGREFGSLLIAYILDVKTRIALYTAHKKLLSLARLIASSRPVSYRECVEAYMNLSAADIGFAFFRTGDFDEWSYRMLVWEGTDVRETLLRDFVPSEGSILRAETSTFPSVPVEGEQDDARLSRFRKRIAEFPGIDEEARGFALKCLDETRSYVAYPLHLLGQDLGAVVLGSRRAKFWDFLHMNPFLDLYNSLLKSFLLNERVIHHLSGVSLRIHNPGFYCLGQIKSTLALEFPAAFENPHVHEALEGLYRLLSQLHDQGRVLRCREKLIQLLRWIQAFVGRKAALVPHVSIRLDCECGFQEDCRVRAGEEQLETIFENLFSNSLRAISARQRREPAFTGIVSIRLRRYGPARVEVVFQDNGISYETVSGRGLNQVGDEMRNLGGTLRVCRKPFRIILGFLCADNRNGRDPHERESDVS